MRTYEDIFWAVQTRRMQLQGVHGLIIYLGREEIETLNKEHRYMFGEEMDEKDMTMFGETIKRVDTESHLGLGLEITD